MRAGPGRVRIAAVSAEDAAVERRIRRWSLWLGIAAAFAAVFAASYRDALGGRVYAYKDLFRLFIPDASFLLQCLRVHELPLWIPYERMGQPFAAKLQGQAFYPLRVLPLLLTGAVRVNTIQQLLHVPLAAAGVFVLARKLGRSRVGSAIAALGFALSPLFTHATWVPPVVNAAAWAGWVGLAAVRLGQRPTARRAGWVALALAMAFLAGSPETVLWEAGLAVALAMSIQPTRTVLRWSLLAGGWAFALCAPMAVPGLELARESVRMLQDTERLAWSLSWPQLAALAMPSADLPRTAVWSGDQWYFNQLFLGALVCTLALIGARGRGARKALVVVGAVCLGLALGEHLFLARWIWSLPGLSAFRYPVKVLMGTAFSAAVLSSYGADRIAAWVRRVPWGAREWIRLLLAALVVGGMIALLLSRLPVRAGLRGGFGWLLAVVLFTAVCAAFVPRPMRSAGAIRWLLLATASVEVLLFQRLHPITGVDPQRLERPSVLGAAIPRPYSGRISVQLPYNEIQTVGDSEQDYLQKSRDALVPLTFVEERLSAIEGDGAPEPRRAEAFVALGGRAAMDLAGVGYYVRRGQSPYRDLVAVRSAFQLPTLYATRVMPPRTFIATRAVRASDREVLQRLSMAELPPRDVVYLADGKELPGTDCSGTAKIVGDGLRTVEVEVDACAESQLVLADAYFPGWHATVDGQEAEIHRADYALRAVEVGPGKHRVVFHYLPASFVWGCIVGAIAWALLAWALLKTRWARRRLPRVTAPTPAATG